MAFFFTHQIKLVERTLSVSKAVIDTNYMGTRRFLDVTIAEYARRRAQEIESLTQNILGSRMMANMQAFQTLPRHMRRRAASYDTRRLPRRLRNIQQSQVGP